jgi:hypothetical protein
MISPFCGQHRLVGGAELTYDTNRYVELLKLFPVAVAAVTGSRLLMARISGEFICFDSAAADSVRLTPSRRPRETNTTDRSLLSAMRGYSDQASLHLETPLS